MATVQLTGDWLQSIGNLRQSTGTITFSNSYTTGGESLTPAMVGLSSLLNIDFNTGISGLIFVWDRANNKVKVFYPTGGGTVPAALAAPLITAGATSVTSSAANGAADITAGQAVEVAASTDLHTVVVDFIAVGR